MSRPTLYSTIHDTGGTLEQAVAGWLLRYGYPHEGFRITGENMGGDAGERCITVVAATGQTLFIMVWGGFLT